MDHKTDTDAGRAALEAYLKDCDRHAIVPDVGGAFYAGRTSLAASAGSEPVAAALPEIKDMRNAPQHLNPNDRAMWVLGWMECRDAVRDAAHAATGPRAANDPGTHPSPPEGMVGGWQDIATAPKDGTRVIIAEGEKVVRAWYVVVPYSESRDTNGRYIDHTDHDEFWMGDDGDVYDEPTHWQPEAQLPAPPIAAGGGKEAG